MNYDDDSTKPKTDATTRVRDGAASALDFPEVLPSEEPLAHPEPTFSQMLAHARLLLSWENDKDAFLKRRRAFMNPERFVL